MARSFAGVSDLITVSAAAVLSPTAKTMTSWVNVTAFPAAGTGYAVVFSQDNAVVWQLLIKTNGKIAFYNSIGQYDGTGSNTLSLSTWYHMATVYDSVNGGIGYVNGSVDGSSVAGGSLPTGATTLYFGDQAASPVRPLNGVLADVTMWSTNLTASEILALSKGARPHTIRSGSLVGFWPLDGLKSPEPDLSGNANNGSLTGTALASGPPFSFFTPRWPQFIPGAAGGSAIKFRKTLSQIGGRVGTRQPIGWGI